MTDDQELGGMALWVERAHGDQAHAYIDTMIKYLAIDRDGLAKWCEARLRLSHLHTDPVPIDCQPETGVR